MEKIVGFDIGESSVKLVYFAGADLKKAVTAELPDNMVSGSRILSMDAMADFLRQTAKSNGIPLTHAALVLPSTEVFTRELVMPAMTEQQLLYNLPYEFRDYLTEEKNKYFFDYSMREVLRDESGQPTEMNLLACATLKSTVESYRTMLRRAGFRLRVLTPSECAYSAVLQAYYRRTQQEGHLPVYLPGRPLRQPPGDRGGDVRSGASGGRSVQRGHPRGSRVCAPELQPCAGVGAGP